MSRHEDGSARCLIHTTGFHSDDTVFHDVDDSDAVFAAQSVQLGDDLGNFHLFPIQRFRDTCFECHGHVFRFVRRLLRWNCEHEQIVIVGLHRRIFQFQSLVADVPEVSVTAVAVLGVKGKIDAVFAAVFDLILTGLHGPEIGHTPGSDDLDIRSQSTDAQLKTNLVVPFSCCAVADSYRAFLAGDLHQFL